MPAAANDAGKSSAAEISDYTRKWHVFLEKHENPSVKVICWCGTSEKLTSTTQLNSDIDIYQLNHIQSIYGGKDVD